MAAPEGNKYALGNNGGRPPKFDNPEQLENKCIDYFNYCIEEGEKVTITGLTLYLGFCDRSSLKDYIDKKEFSHIIKRAKLVVENSYESNGNTIDIFALKNMGWIDKLEVKNEHSGEIKTDKPVDLSGLSTEDLKTYLQIQSKIES